MTSDLAIEAPRVPTGVEDRRAAVPDAVAEQLPRRYFPVFAGGSARGRSVAAAGARLLSRPMRRAMPGRPAPAGLRGQSPRRWPIEPHGDRRNGPRLLGVSRTRRRPQPRNARILAGNPACSACRPRRDKTACGLDSRVRRHGNPRRLRFPAGGCDKILTEKWTPSGANLWPTVPCLAGESNKTMMRPRSIFIWRMPNETAVT
jgi:hypothetical protein